MKIDSVNWDDVDVTIQGLLVLGVLCWRYWEYSRYLLPLIHIVSKLGKFAVLEPTMLSLDCIMIVASELASIRSSTQLSIKFESLVTRLRMRWEQTTYVRAIYTLYDVLFPPSHVLTILRVLCGWFVCVCIYPVALYSAYYACGLTQGILSTDAELSPSCVNVYSAYDDLPHWTRQQRMENSFCFGEEAGLELQACLQDLATAVASFIENSLMPMTVLVLVVLCLMYFFFLLLRPYWKAEPSIPVPTDARLSSYAERAAEYFSLRSANYELKVLVAKLRQELKKAEERVSAANKKYNEEYKRASKVETIWIEVVQIDVGLRREISFLKEQLSRFQGSTIQILTDQVARLTQELANSEGSAANSRSEVDSLKRALQAKEERLTATEKSIREIQDAAEKASREVQTLAAAKITDSASQYDNLKLSYDKVVEQLRTLEAVKQERDDAAARVIHLQGELESTKRIANEVYGECVRANGAAQDKERALSERFQAVQSAFEEQCRARQEKVVADAVSQAKASAVAAFQAEQEELRRQLEKARSDAQVGQQEAQILKEEVENLQLDLARFGVSFGSSQSIPERKAANPSSSLVRGSIKTALEDRDLKIQALEHEVEELRKKSREGLTDARLKAVADKLGKDLKEEKAARTNDQLRWHKQLQELQEENRKQRISLSNAESALGRRRTSK